MKVMLRRNAAGVLSVYVPKKDLEEPIVAQERDDLWGGTVNMASRMEHYGLSNVIQVTESTCELISDKFRFEKREPITVKGKGKVQSYFLIGRISSDDDIATAAA